MPDSIGIRGQMMRLRLLASAGFAALLLGASPASAQISLGTAESFGVLGGSTVTNTGSSVISGNLGVSPGTAVTGFPPGIVTPPGTIHSADAVAAQAQVDLTTAYNAITSTPTLVDLTGTDLGGLTLTPGVYGFSASAQLTGTLTLDAQGDPNAVFIFKMGSTLTTATGSSVLVINSGSNCNVFWQVGSSATLGTTTTFAGNILALTSITLNTGANVSGRTLARNGAVTLSGNNVAVCAPAPIVCPVITLSPSSLPNGQVGSAYSQSITASGSAALPYTYSVSSGALPPGLSLNPATGAITGSPVTAGTFNFTIRATDTNGCFGVQAYTIAIAAAGCPVITLSPLTLPSGQLGTAYSQTVIASGGTGPYTYALSGTLPTGLTLNPATGAITGTPSAAGIFNFTITATDSNGCPGSRPYSIVIAAVICPVITLSPAALPAGHVGFAYSQAVVASGGTAPYVYALVGTLPPGLSFSTTTGTLTGIPTTPGTYNFAITATDANNCLASEAYGMVIVSTTSTGIPTLTEWGMLILIMLMGFVALRYRQR